MEFQDGFPNYEVLAQHDEVTGVKVRKKLMNVFWGLLVITLIEVAIGWFWQHSIKPALGLSQTWLIVGFIGFTLLKAGYIVMTFMHLGDENKWMRWMILAPYFLFIIYLIYMTTVGEGMYSMEFRNLMNPVTEMAPAAPTHH